MVEVHSVCLLWETAELYFRLLFPAPDPAVLQQQQIQPRMVSWRLDRADTESFLATRHKWFIFVVLHNVDIWRLSALPTWIKGIKETSPVVLDVLCFLGLTHVGLCSHTKCSSSSTVDLTAFPSRHLTPRLCWQPWRYFVTVLLHLAHKCLHTVSRVVRSKSLMTSWSLE